MPRSARALRGARARTLDLNAGASTVWPWAIYWIILCLSFPFYVVQLTIVRIQFAYTGQVLKTVLDTERMHSSIHNSPNREQRQHPTAGDRLGKSVQRHTLSAKRGEPGTVD